MWGLKIIFDLDYPAPAIVRDHRPEIKDKAGDTLLMESWTVAWLGGDMDFPFGRVPVERAFTVTRKSFDVEMYNER